MEIAVEEALEYLYVIDGYKPETLPMARLAEYVTQWAKLLGETSDVHFDRVRGGSAVLVAMVRKAAASKVEGRVRGLRDGTAPPEVRESFKRLNNLLVEDKSFGRMEGGAEILAFPGIKRVLPMTYGPFNQDGTLDGRLVRIGGRTEIKAWIDDGKVTRPCTVTKEQAKKMATHLFDMVRVAGRGRWSRDGEGEWKMLSFKVASFEPLDEKPLSEVLAKLRAIQGNGWREFEDPYEELRRLRHGDD
jgi:hypothetical protein